MRGSFTGAYVRRTGDTMTGALTIATDVTPGLIIDRPDGSDYRAMDIRRAGTMVWHILQTLAEPRLRIRDAASVERVNIQTTDGKILLGVVPLARMQVAESIVTNTVAVTVTAAQTIVVSSASVTVALGDRLLIFGEAFLTKGATAGRTEIVLQNTGGTGLVTGPRHLSSAGGDVEQSQTASGGLLFGCGTIYHVDNAGTITMSVVMTSAGSNGTVAIGDCGIHLIVLQGT